MSNWEVVEAPAIPESYPMPRDLDFRRHCEPYLSSLHPTGSDGKERSL